MPVVVSGGPELAARLDNMRGVFRAVGIDWEEETIRLAQTRVHIRTGKALSSLRGLPVNKKGDARVSAIWYSKFQEGGAKAHDIVPRLKLVAHRKPPKRPPKVAPRLFHALAWGPTGHKTFARRVHRRAQIGDHWLGRSGAEAIESTRILDSLEKSWG